jgi:hypothetical protein
MAIVAADSSAAHNYLSAYPPAASPTAPSSSS